MVGASFAACRPLKLIIAPDKNGKFLIQKKMSWDLRTDNITQFELLRNGDVVRLIHVETGKHIHATTNRPPVTDNEFHFEVSAHPTEVSRDSTDNWRVVVINPLPGDDTVKAMHSMVKFESIMRRCTLFSQRKKLPDWGLFVGDSSGIVELFFPWLQDFSSKKSLARRMEKDPRLFGELNPT
ncbi:hypothetical protein HDU84_007814 [Entophlyctis sp. JEL0112]|nr:hypothetical protein HDU84_007814 [Entophlyctis sp. JEL0112]